MIKKIVKKLIPLFLFDWYHLMMAFLAALIYRFPSRKLVVIGVTGTSGKSTTIDFISSIFEAAGKKVASASTVRFRIGKREWKNNLKMTMPGRFAVQKFLRQALDAGCTHVVLEVTSEGIRQHRHKFIHFDTAVFTNLTPEHIESHGGFENYRNEKLKLFYATPGNHIINADDENAKYFLDVPARQKIPFGKDFSMGEFTLQMLGSFNQYNAMAAATVAGVYGIGLDVCKKALEKVHGIAGRMEVVSQKPLVVVDYAHTPEQLEKVYQTFSSRNQKSQARNQKLICVLGSCGGGRDKWKRPVLGTLAQQYCQEIIITDEDPYDEDPLEIMQQVAAGIDPEQKPNHYRMVLDRKEAIVGAVAMAKPEDVVVITGKGSEALMCLKDGKKIAWDDQQIARDALGAAK